MAGHVDLQESVRRKLTDHRAPLRHRQFLADTIGAEFVMAELLHLFAIRAAQHVDDMQRAEALASAVDAGQRLLRQLGAVEAFHRLQASIAIAARSIRRLAEIAQQHLAAALRGLAETDQRLELAPLDLLLCFRRFRARSAQQRPCSSSVKTANRMRTMSSRT
jgi:hypothetical protein